MVSTERCSKCYKCRVALQLVKEFLVRRSKIHWVYCLEIRVFCTVYTPAALSRAICRSYLQRIKLVEVPSTSVRHMTILGHVIKMCSIKSLSQQVLIRVDLVQNFSTTSLLYSWRQLSWRPRALNPCPANTLIIPSVPLLNTIWYQLLSWQHYLIRASGSYN